jgi:hypothetical protein
MIADVSGSTPLYEQYGDEKASKLLFECVEGMQKIASDNKGQFVRSKGDDVLCLFDDPEQALETVQKILEHGALGSVSVHAGLHWGQVLWRNADLFGVAINIAARLASRATDNEVLISEAFRERIPQTAEIELRGMGTLTLKGMAEPMGVHALLAAAQDDLTRQIVTTDVPLLSASREENGLYVQLSHSSWESSMSEGDEVTIGRSQHCDLVLSESWISRVHASISINHGLVEFTDRSAAGSTVAFGDDHGYFIRRQTMALTGTGKITLGDPALGGDLPEISFEISRSM